MRRDDEEWNALGRIPGTADYPWMRAERLQLTADRMRELRGRRGRPRPDENVNLAGHAHPL